MKRILILRTSNDGTIFKLFEEIYDNQLYCMIQSSQVERYKNMYPKIHFIDIKQEGFYNLDESVMKEVKNTEFEEVYITFTGEVGHNYGNIMSMVKLLNFKKGYFYNCLGERVEIPKMGIVKDLLYKIYIKICEILY